VALQVSKAQKPEGWVVGVWPQGMSHGSPMGNDPTLTTDHARLEIARVFDRWLVEAPSFMAAFFGGEAHDFLLNGGLAEIDSDGVEGLVVDQAMWESLNRPASARMVGAGRHGWPRSRTP
jgi:hypothetical protein